MKENIAHLQYHTNFCGFQLSSRICCTHQRVAVINWQLSFFESFPFQVSHENQSRLQVWLFQWNSRMNHSLRHCILHISITRCNCRKDQKRVLKSNARRQVRKITTRSTIKACVFFLFSRKRMRVAYHLIKKREENKGGKPTNYNIAKAISHQQQT